MYLFSRNATAHNVGQDSIRNNSLVLTILNDAAEKGKSFEQLQVFLFIYFILFKVELFQIFVFSTAFIWIRFCNINL